MSPVQIAHLIDTDNPSQLEEDLRTIMAKHRNDGSLSSSKQPFSSNTNNIASEGKCIDIKTYKILYLKMFLLAFKLTSIQFALQIRSTR